MEMSFGYVQNCIIYANIFGHKVLESRTSNAAVNVAGTCDCSMQDNLISNLQQSVTDQEKHSTSWVPQHEQDGITQEIKPRHHNCKCCFAQIIYIGQRLQQSQLYLHRQVGEASLETISVLHIRHIMVTATAAAAAAAGAGKRPQSNRPEH